MYVLLYLYCNHLDGVVRAGCLLNLSSWYLVMVEWFFLAVKRGCLRFVIVVFPDHTHLLFLYVVLTRSTHQFREETYHSTEASPLCHTYTSTLSGYYAANHIHYNFVMFVTHIFYGSFIASNIFHAKLNCACHLNGSLKL